MNMKTLLGTAAGLMVASGAYAADLPGEAAPVAVDYVKVCDAYGAGFFYIPGTETCLQMSGRVRARIAYTNHATLSAAGAKTYTLASTTTGLDGTYSTKELANLASASAVAAGGAAGTVTENPGAAAVVGDRISFKTDARVRFDARTASDLGTVRSFFAVKLDSADGSIAADDAFIQVGYLTVGKFGNGYGDVFYGDTGAIYGAFDQSSTGAQIMVDKLGGGFYVGAGIQASNTGSLGTSSTKWNASVWDQGSSAELMYTGRFGINGQSWGSADVSAFYQALDGDANDIWGVKATADLKLVDKLSARLVATYEDFDADSYFGAAAALKYKATDALAVYAGIGSAFWDKADTAYKAQLGADYAFTPDLILTAEVNYTSDGGYAKGDFGSGTTDDNWDAMLKLTRNW
ncbi:porin [Pleomorphomonas sp. JP5]|uniref:porin n=1 Tax=Pleomorphomonas sp. JP5 TaxID=2942998 RepID=UPI0020444BEC|nr:porin [Pleomorphomonas sp. JP5]MCM5559882.1 porin [Pleomorphomonas sp. JP5]